MGFPSKKSISCLQCVSKKNPVVLLAREGKKESFWSTIEHSILLNKACPQEKLVNQSPTCLVFISAYLTWEKGNAILPILSHLRRVEGIWVGLRSNDEVHRFTERPRQHRKTTERFPPTPHRHITIRSIYGSSLTQHFMSRYSEKKLQDILKW